MDKPKQASNDSQRIATSDYIEVSTYLGIADCRFEENAKNWL
jgi:hypothetical protein